MLENGKPCPNCYTYMNICDDHEEFKYITFQQMKEARIDALLVMHPGIDYFGFKKVSPDMYVNMYENWRERIYTFSSNQSRHV